MKTLGDHVALALAGYALFLDDGVGRIAYPDPRAAWERMHPEARAEWLRKADIARNATIYTEYTEYAEPTIAWLRRFVEEHPECQRL